MKNILLKFDDKRLQFLQAMTFDFKGREDTDRVNYALDRLPVLLRMLRQSVSDADHWEQEARNKQIEVENLQRNLNEIKHAPEVSRVSERSNSKKK